MDVIFGLHPGKETLRPCMRCSAGSICRDARWTRCTPRAAGHTIPRLATRPPLPPAEIYRILAGQRQEVLLLLLAKTTAVAAKQQIVAYLETYRDVKPEFSGHDLRAMGLTPGPLFRTLLTRLLEARLNGEVTNALEERAFVQRLL